MSFDRTTNPAPAEQYRNVRCSDCAAALTPVWAAPDADPDAPWQYLQAEHALHVRLGGGYDEFVDLLEGERDDDMHLLLCSGCAKKLCDAFPYIKTAVLSHVNMHVGHECAGGNEWVPLKECGEPAASHASLLT